MTIANDDVFVKHSSCTTHDFIDLTRTLRRIGPTHRAGSGGGGSVCMKRCIARLTASLKICIFCYLYAALFRCLSAGYGDGNDTEQYTENTGPIQNNTERLPIQRG